MAYVKNPSDKQMVDQMRASEDSAIRIYWFNGQYQQIGEIKHIKAYDLQEELQPTPQSDAMKHYGNIICSHNDRPWLDR